MTPWLVGTRVEQPTYGVGTVIESSVQHTVIDFDDGPARRIFATHILVLRPLVVAPVVAPPTVTPRAVTKKTPATRRSTKRR